MPSSYPGRHMPLPRLEPDTSGKRWVSVANWATPGWRRRLLLLPVRLPHSTVKVAG
ncbi:hypothetical protein Hanom_Chr01g00064871 [Helianthus anomalus]